MMCAEISDASIEMTAAQSRAAKIVANRRALAALLHHHGNRPPEMGCSAEALWIRRGIRAAANGSAGVAVALAEVDASAPANSEATIRLMAERARPAIVAIVAEVAARHNVPVDLMLAPPRRAAQRSVERRAQLANHEAMHRCYHEACRSYRALGLHFGKHGTAIRKAAALHAERIGAGETSK
jgi:hypothetical protein